MARILLDLKVTILGFEYHVACQHVPESGLISI